MHGESIATQMMDYIRQTVDGDFYIDAINNGFFFDQWNGEFEYLLGMMYELDQNDFNHSNEYYNIALKKGFKFKLLKNEYVS